MVIFEGLRRQTYINEVIKSRRRKISILVLMKDGVPSQRFTFTLFVFQTGSHVKAQLKA